MGINLPDATQGKVTEYKAEEMANFLNYWATNMASTMEFRCSYMMLNMKRYESYLSKHEVQSFIYR